MKEIISHRVARTLYREANSRALAGERGHYELAAGRDPLPFIEAMEKFANEGGMLPEQVWDADDFPEGKMKRGGPTGSAMPLCWAHAEYVILVRSHKNGVSFDRIEPVYQRYVEAVTGSKTEMWTLAHQPSATSRPGRASGTRSSIASSRRSARTGVASRSSATRRW